MDSYQKFVEFFQRVTGSRLTVPQDKVARLILREAGEFIARGTGKTTLFELLEAYADGENEDYLTRAELQSKVEDLERSIVTLQEELRKTKTTE